MFVNLQKALCQKGISIKQYADLLGVDEKTIHDKMRGTTDFTYLELKRTCCSLLPEYSADYLFTACTYYRSSVRLRITLTDIETRRFELWDILITGFICVNPNHDVIMKLIWTYIKD